MIAKVHGLATAAGCQLVATCDLAVASDDRRPSRRPASTSARSAPRRASRWAATVGAQARHGDAAHRRADQRGACARDRACESRRAGRGAGRRGQRHGEPDRQRGPPARSASGKAVVLPSARTARSTRRTPSPEHAIACDSSSPRTAGKGSTPSSESARPRGRSDARDRGDDGRDGGVPRATSAGVAHVPPRLTFAMELHVKVGAPLEVGAVPRGRRRIVPIEGGTFEGPAAPRHRAAGRRRFLAHRSCRRSGGAGHALHAARPRPATSIYIQNAGMRHAPPDVTRRLLAGRGGRPGARCTSAPCRRSRRRPRISQWLTRAILRRHRRTAPQRRDHPGVEGGMTRLNHWMRCPTIGPAAEERLECSMRSIGKR